ncbi:AAA family ATPase [Amycolatopsis sp. NPDC003731]
MARLTTDLLAEVATAVYARLGPVPDGAGTDRLSFEVALARAANAFARNHPRLAPALLDPEFLTGQAVPVFADSLRQQATPDPVALAAAWPDDDDPGRKVRAAADFLRWLDAELRSEPAPDDLPDVLAQAQKYDVTIERAQGIAIGDNARVHNVFNTYFDSDYATLAEYYLPPEEVFERVQVSEFVGRANLLADLDEFLDTADRGVWLLVGEAGVGKSTFLAHLVSERGYLHFFAEQAPGATNVNRAVHSLAAQLISRFRIAPYAQRDTVPGLLAAYPDFLRRLLSAAAAELVHGERLVIVIDALDEAGEVPGQNVLGLPRHLPQGVYLVLSQRDENVPLVIEPAPRRVDLRAHDAANQDDMVVYLRRQSRVPAIAQQLRARNYTTDEFIRVLLENSAGNWIYLHYVLQEIIDGQRAPLDLDALPDDLATYYIANWARWRDTPEWDTIYAPLLVTLGAAFEPLPLSTLKQWSGVDAGDYLLRRVLRDKWGAFVYEVAGSERRYRLYHASLNDFLAGELVPDKYSPYAENLLTELAERTVQAHTDVVAELRSRCGGNWPDLASNDYARRFLTAHLRLSGDLDALFELVQSVAWYEMQMSADSSGIAFINDVDQAWVAAESHNHSALADGHPAPLVADEIRCALAAARTGDISANIPVSLLVALVAGGSWSPAQALAAANLQPDDTQRRQSLAELVTCFGECGFFSDALETVTLIDDVSEQARLLAEITPHLPPTSMRQALATALRIPNGAYIARALEALAPRLSSPLLHEARERAALIDEPLDRQWALGALLPLLPESEQADAWLEVLTAVRQIAGPSTRCRMFAAMAAHLDEARKAAELSDLLAMTGNVADPHEQASCWLALLPMLPEPERMAVRDNVILLTERIQEARERISTALAAIAEMADDRRAPVLADIVDLVEAEADGSERRDLLNTLAHYTGWYHIELPLSLRVRVFRAAASISDNSHRLEAFGDVLDAGLAPPLDEPILWDLVRSVVEEMSAEFYVVFEAIKLLQRLAPLMSEAMYAELLSSAKSIASPYNRREVLDAVSAHVPPSVHHIWRELIRSEEQDQPATPPEPDDASTPVERHPVSPTDMLTAIWSTQADDGYHLAAVRAVAPHAPSEMLPRIIDTAMRLQNPGLRARALASLASRHLPEDVTRQALSLVSCVDGEYNRASVLVSLVPVLPPDSLADAVTVATAIEHPYNRVRSLTHLARRLAGPLRHELIEHCVSFVMTSRYLLQRAEVLALLAPSLDDRHRRDLCEHVLAAIDSTDERRSRPDALGYLLPLLPDSLMPRVSAIATATSDVEERIRMVAVLADRLPAVEREDRLADALAEVLATADAFRRVQNFTAILPHLPERLKTSDHLEMIFADAQELATAGIFLEGINLAEILPHVDRSYQLPLLPEALADVARLAKLDTERERGFHRLLPIMTTLPPADLYPLWNNTLLVCARGSAASLVQDISSLWPVLSLLGGQDAPAAVAQVILDNL